MIPVRFRFVIPDAADPALTIAYAKICKLNQLERVINKNLLVNNLVNSRPNRSLNIFCITVLVSGVLSQNKIYIREKQILGVCLSRSSKIVVETTRYQLDRIFSASQFWFQMSTLERSRFRGTQYTIATRVLTMIGSKW